AAIYTGMGLHEKALADLSKAISLKPENATFWRLRAATYAELGRWEKAGADFGKASELTPHDALSRYSLALTRLQLGDHDGYRKVGGAMIGHFGPSANADSSYWTFWTWALAPAAVTDWQAVVQMAEKSLAADPKNCEKLQHFGAVLYRAGRFEDAAKRLAQA